MLDLLLIEMGAAFLIQPRSILGVVWLQTHFEPATWDLICSGRVRLSACHQASLCADAEAAGLRLGCLRAPAVPAC
ncbi:MAG: hypothetical protein RLZZ336_1591 [Cyanobacteriota bacterium]|jgi:acyl CoA:acetate/3-ketoacid CoA transferase alpha subunit